ncbi:MAG TPA: hypothetical protein PKV97_00200 [Thauera aminoaromatica]|nr:hypothetical protein [Thauera aminoaromatica]
MLSNLAFLVAEHATRVMSEPGSPTVEQITALNKAVNYLETANGIFRQLPSDFEGMEGAGEAAVTARAVISQWTPSAPVASLPESAHPDR